MRVAIFHNRYLHRGGEDSVVDVEVELLRKAGHSVRTFFVDNRDEIAGRVMGALRAGWSARWNRTAHSRVGEFLEEEPVDVGHVHNFFPLLSPAVHAALRAHGVPVVQTLHNYRLLCANGLLLRRGLPCEECVTRGPWNSVRYGCYRGSRIQTAVWAEQAALHRRRDTWGQLVDLFTVPSELARRKLLAAGLAPERLVVKPNPVADPGRPAFGGRGAVFVGRLSAEKGVASLLEAWKGVAGVPLTIIGSGPEEPSLRRRAAALPGVRFLGRVGRERVQAELRAAAFAVQPSIAYETFCLTVVEAMAAGTPTVATRGTAPGELVEHGRTGLLFDSGDVAGLAEACRRLAADSGLAESMGREARANYEERFTPEVSLQALVAVYERALARRGRSRGGAQYDL
jgi:glycosyltransferase involved in cell wall biosynthesis